MMSLMQIQHILGNIVDNDVSDEYENLDIVDLCISADEDGPEPLDLPWIYGKGVCTH